MRRHLMTGFFLVGALACYAAGFGAGMFGFLIVGFLFELAFWGRLFGVGRTRTR